MSWVPMQAAEALVQPGRYAFLYIDPVSKPLQTEPRTNVATILTTLRDCPARVTASVEMAAAAKAKVLSEAVTMSELTQFSGHR